MAGLRITELKKLTTSARMTQNECYGQVLLNFKLSKKWDVKFADVELAQGAFTH